MAGYPFDLAMLCYWGGLFLAALSLLGCVTLLALAWRRTRGQIRRLWIVSNAVLAVVLIGTPLLLRARAESVMDVFGARAMTPMIISASGYALGLILAGTSLALLLLSFALFHDDTNA